MENANKTSEMTQKDIIQFLLQQAQHTVTREELKDEIRELKNDLISKIDATDKKIDDVRDGLNKKIDDVRSEIKDVRSEIKEVRSELKGDYLYLNKRFDRLTWYLVATIVSIFAKDYIIKALEEFFNR